MSYITTRNHMRRGVSSVGILLGAAAVVVVISVSLLGTSGGGSVNTSDAAAIYAVAVGDFEVMIPASGELAAGDQTEIRSMVDGTATITEIIDEGTSVKQGDLLVRMDDKETIERIQSAEEAVTEATNRVETKTADLEISQKSRESNLAASQVSVDQATLALQAWSEGDAVAYRNELSLAVRTAKKDFSRLEEKYQKSIELRAKDFISQNDLEQDEITMIRAEAALSRANLNQEVYEKYTFKKDKQRFESDLAQAKDELIRSETRTKATVQSARSTLEAATTNLASKKERLDRYRNDLEACTIVSPSGGLVVYGTSLGRDRWDREDSLKVGSRVSRNRLLIVLPDTSRMLANVKVNEALSGLVKADQKATIRLDAFPDTVLTGNVLSIGVLAESGGWRDPNRRDYSVTVELDNIAALPLKPSMRCQASILVDHVTEVAYVPVQAIHRTGRQTVVYVSRDGVFESRPVDIGRTSELYAEITSGLVAGELVLLTDPPVGTVVEQEDKTEL
jgi:HlyD family secretion protein